MAAEQGSLRVSLSHWDYSFEGRRGGGLFGVQRIRVGVVSHISTFSCGLDLRRVAANPSCQASSQDGYRKKSKNGSIVGVTKRDIDLVKKLQEFISSEGLPPDKVPSTRELAASGRQDLANAVRRRGYKAVAQLLATEEVLWREDRDDVNDGNNGVHNLISSCKTVPVAANSAVQEGTDFSEDRQPVSVDLSSWNTEGTAGPSFCEESLSEKSPFDCANVKKIPHNADGNATQSSSVLPVKSALHEEALEFIRSGRFVDMEDLADGKEEKKDNNHGDHGKQDFADDNLAGNSVSENDEDISSHFGTEETLAARKAAHLRSKLSLFMDVREHSEDSPSSEEVPPSKGLMKVQDVQSIPQVNDYELDLQRHIQVELDRIKMALLSRELELSKMSRELEEAKAQLALFHAKSTAELAQTKQTLLEKELSLQVAQQVLSQLKQVEVEWWGEGSKVELAGSFNGWQYNIPMDPDPSSEIPNLDGSRGPMMWCTKLWLYPGFYEIKFIVDGIWTVNQRREIVARNMGQNNILQVDD